MDVFPLVTPGNWSFTKSFYEQIKSAPNNIVVSPFSVHAVLTMAMVGARGSSAKALSDVLGISDSQEILEEYSKVLEKMRGCKFWNFGNKIFISNSESLKGEFSSSMQNKFYSEVTKVNFNDDRKTVVLINKWVKKQTNNKIENILESLDKSTRLLLINACYFKGIWENKFEEKRTQESEFHLLDGGVVKVMMMNQNRYNLTAEDEELEAKLLMLPYEGQTKKMIIFLPNSRRGLPDLEKKLNHYNFSSIQQKLEGQSCAVYLPRFKIEFKIEMKSILQKIGLEVIFSNEADFSGMIDSSELLLVDEVIQKAFVEVNEGAQNAATTKVSVMKESQRYVEEFRVDHPFLFGIFYEDIIILLARVTDPTET